MRTLKCILVGVTIAALFSGCAILRGATRVASSTVSTTVKTTGKVVGAVVPGK